MKPQPQYLIYFALTLGAVMCLVAPLYNNESATRDIQQAGLMILSGAIGGARFQRDPQSPTDSNVTVTREYGKPNKDIVELEVGPSDSQCDTPPKEVR